MARSASKRAVIWLHKWLGVGLACFFAMWFASGIVLYFIPFPSLTDGERLSALPELATGSGCCMTADEAARQAGLKPDSARLGMYGGRPVWRVLGSRLDAPGGQAPRWHVLDASTGAMQPALDATHAALLAEAFSRRRAVAVQALMRDQWTVPQGLDPYRPLFKVSLGPGPQGDDGLQLYVSAGAAEVVRDTRRAERFWNWLGAVPHWIYPTVLRQFPRAWHHVVVWLSIPGVVLAISGLVLGVWQLFLNRTRWIPYRKFWMRWHHVLGLVAAVFTLTWIFSGLLSMNPFGIFNARVPDLQEQQQWRGQEMPVRLAVADAIHSAHRQGLHPVELDMTRVGSQSWYRLRDAGRQWLVRADRPIPGEATERLPDSLVHGTLTGLRQQPPTRLEQLQAYDELYYTRHPDSPDKRWQRPLPVWRATWADGVTVYADPGSGRILLRVDGAGRWQRLFYNGLHSLDFGPLLARPRLRDALVVGLSLLGLAMCLTACVLAWRIAKPRSTGRSRGSEGD
jgi:uncharacterized iron-regulated membrane protein